MANSVGLLLALSFVCVLRRPSCRPWYDPLGPNCRCRGDPIMAKRGGKRRDPAREKFWRRTIREQQRSGLAVRDFCLRERLKDWTFRWWRQELGRRDRELS